MLLLDLKKRISMLMCYSALLRTVMNAKTEQGMNKYGQWGICEWQIDKSRWSVSKIALIAQSVWITTASEWIVSDRLVDRAGLSRKIALIVQSIYRIALIGIQSEPWMMPNRYRYWCHLYAVKKSDFTSLSYVDALLTNLAWFPPTFPFPLEIYISDYF